MKAAKKVKTISKTAVQEEAVAAVGIDLGDRWSHWCALSSTGEVIDRGRVKTSAEALSEVSAGWAGIPVAIENGTHSGWISRTLKMVGCTVWVANPSRWRGTAHSSKNDANDAEALARSRGPARSEAVVSDHASDSTTAGGPFRDPSSRSAGEGQDSSGEHRARRGKEYRRTLAGDRCGCLPQHEVGSLCQRPCGKHCGRSISRSPRSPSKSALSTARLRSSRKRGIKRQLCSAACLVLDPLRL